MKNLKWIKPLLIIVAMAAGMGIDKIGGVPRPTPSESIKRTTGLYNQTRLTPTVARPMEK